MTYSNAVNYFLWCFSETADSIQKIANKVNKLLEHQDDNETTGGLENLLSCMKVSCGGVTVYI